MTNHILFNLQLELVTANASPTSQSLGVTLSQRVAELKHLANLAIRGTAVLGLTGMGGIGKTFLARALFNELRMEFVACCFLEVGGLPGAAALLQLQTVMLRDLCGIALQPASVTEGRAQLAARLHSAQVLLVLDNIWMPAQLDALLVPVGKGSCVLVTSRDEDLLHSFGIQCRYRVDMLSQADALELFLRHAQLPPDCRDLADSFVEACSGLPLSLAVIGDFLQGKQDREQWEQALHKLQAASEGADDPLLRRLRLSYDALSEPEQQMFLDIACFMLGKDACACLPVWGPLAQTLLGELESRAVVEVGGDGRLAMHDLLRSLGQTIVTEEQSIPVRRSHIWMPDSETAISSSKVWQ